MHENNMQLKHYKKLMETPPQVDRNKVPPECRNCEYFQPQFRYRQCLYAICPYGKGEKATFRNRPLKKELITRS